MSKPQLVIVLLMAMFFVAPQSFAVLPEEILKDPALEARARVISQDLRCLVCQNQSIDDSNAPLAKDLRVIVRERLTAGATNEQVFDYVVSRYGNYVLLNPPLQSDTFLLWASPFIMLVIALSVALVYLRRRPEVEYGFVVAVNNIMQCDCGCYFDPSYSAL
jgi:cytochrome c-type biogenesis protein CcmH